MPRIASIGLLLSGCMAYPTTLGLRSSGDVLDASRAGEVGLHGGAAGFHDGAGDQGDGVGAALAPVGGDLVLGILPGRLDLAMSGTAGPLLTNRKLEGGNTYDNPWNVRAEARFSLGALPGRRAWNMLVVGGGSTTQVTTWNSRHTSYSSKNTLRFRGAHVGFIHGGSIGDVLQLYGGYTVNPVWVDSYLDEVWMAATAGLRTASERDLRVGVEVTGLVSSEGHGGQAMGYVTYSWDRQAESGR